VKGAGRKRQRLGVFLKKEKKVRTARPKRNWGKKKGKVGRRPWGGFKKRETGGATFPIGGGKGGGFKKWRVVTSRNMGTLLKGGGHNRHRRLPLRGERVGELKNETFLPLRPHGWGTERQKTTPGKKKKKKKNRRKKGKTTDTKKGVP